jgi:protein-disulfide isomerase
MREIWFAVAMLTLVAAVPAQAQNLVTPPPPTPPPAAPAPAAPAEANPLAVTADDRVLGKTDAAITIIEYGSLTCPHCAAFAAEVMPGLTKKWIDSGKAKLIFRPFPRDEIDLHAATVAMCAAPDRFYPFIDALFAAQGQWMVASDYKAALARMALLGGMNKTTFDGCFDNKDIQDKLLAARLAASKQLAVDSTPTFFINGKKFNGTPNEDEFDSTLSKLTGS